MEQITAFFIHWLADAAPGGAGAAGDGASGGGAAGGGVAGGGVAGDGAPGGGAPGGAGDGTVEVAPGGGPFDFFFQNPMFPILAIFMIFWLLVFLPEGRKRKEREKKVTALKKGDQVVTTGGILGKVTQVDERSVTVQVDKNKDVRIRILKTSVFEVVTAEDSKGKALTEGEAPPNPTETA
ncbi:MAG: preprotein translocase subunit YajC [Planctomycetota bacterium]